MKYEFRDKKTVFSAKAFDVEKVNYKLPDGRLHGYDLVRHLPSVSIVPVDHDRNIWFVRQYRVGPEAILLELPAGVLEEHEDPQAGALREVREEIGLAAGKIRLIGDMYLAPGYCSERMYVFLATDLIESPLEPDEDEFIEKLSIPVDKAYEMAGSGEIHDSKSLAALLLARPYLL